MRVVFVGASNTAVITAGVLLKRGHDVVIIENDKGKIEELSDKLDCGFLNGDGTKPALLKEAGPEQTDFLFCLTGNDQANIIASLLGRSLGFKRVVTKIQDEGLEHICAELGLTNTIVPTRMAGRFLADMVAGIDVLELSTMLKGEARIFSFVVGEDGEGPAEELELPEKARLICYYRDGEFNLTDPDTKLQKGDEAVVLTHSGNLAELRERFSPKKKEKVAEPPPSNSS